MNIETEKLIARYVERERLARKEAESLLEVKSRQLYTANKSLLNLTDSLEQKIQERTGELELARDQAMQANEAKSAFLANVSHELRTPLNAVIGLSELMEDLPMTKQVEEYHKLIQSSSKMLFERINELLDLSKIEAGRFEVIHESFKLSELVDESVAVLAQSAFSKGIDLTAYVAPGIPEALIGDPLHLRQIITNLLNNAIKFTEHGGIAIAFTGATCSKDNVTVEFIVEDSGIGMSPEALNKVFEPFQQAESDTSRRYGGTGLGLTLCRRLIEFMGGSLTVESSAGKGSIFRGRFECQASPGQPIEPPATRDLNKGQAVVLFSTPLTGRWLERIVADCGYDVTGLCIDSSTEIPSALLEKSQLIVADCCARKYTQLTGPKTSINQRVFIASPVRHCTKCAFEIKAGVETITKPISANKLISALKPIVGTQPEGIVVQGNTPPTKSIRILVADDNYVNQVVIQGQLKKLGYPPKKIVSCGASALAAAKEEPFDLILMDCEMPEMDGIEATQHIRASENLNRETPIAALTAHALSDYSERCLAAGMNFFLSKPVKLTDLTQLLEKIAPPSQ